MIVLIVDLLVDVWWCLCLSFVWCSNVVLVVIVDCGYWLLGLDVCLWWFGYVQV